MSGLEAIETENAPAAIGPYVQALRGGGLLWCSGQIGLDPATGALVGGGVVPQARRALANLDAVLRAAGIGFDAVVKTTLYLVDLADFAAVNEVYAELLGEARPARATVGVAALPKQALVEVDCVGVLSGPPAGPPVGPPAGPPAGGRR